MINLQNISIAINVGWLKSELYGTGLEKETTSTPFKNVIAIGNQLCTSNSGFLNSASSNKFSANN
jgi:hypothetical protein